MRNSLPARLPAAVKLGVPLAAALLAAACSSSTSSGTGGTGGSGSGMVITTASGSAGAYLTDGSGRAVYLWVKDSTDKSECSGACAVHWAPVPASGNVTASGSAKASDLGTITRSDGSKQVTYDGHPLYYYFGDSGSGQTNGQGSNDFGAQWWLIAPSGAQLTGSSVPNAPASPSSSKSSAGGGWA